MPVLIQSIGGNAIDHIIATFQITGQTVIDPSSTSFIYGQMIDTGSGYNFTTNHFVAHGHNITYDFFGPATGTLTSLELHGPHLSGAPGSDDHTFPSLLKISGAAFDVGSFRLAVLLEDAALLQAQLEQQQWTFKGSTQGDEFTGGILADKIYGKAGNDTLGGGNGSDHLWGGKGADILNGGDGIDFARYDDANYGDLIISLAKPSVNTGAAAGDTYSGIEGIIGGLGADTIMGDNLANRLTGGGGNDIIKGAGGRDIINGGEGKDVLTGGAGLRDDFVFNTALGSGNVDRIVDFEHGLDKILLSGAIFGDIGATLDASEFGSSADPDNFIIYNQATGKLSYDAGGSAGGPGPVVFATVAAGTVLDVKDFLLTA